MMTQNQYHRSIGQAIRRYRKKKQWSIEQLAEKANLHHNYVGELERGEKQPSFFTFHKIVFTLDIEVKQFFEQVETNVNMEQLIVDGLDGSE